MGYALLWMGGLAAALLLVATVLAAAGRLRRRWARILWPSLTAMALLGTYVGLTVLAGCYSIPLLAAERWFWTLLVSTLIYGMGAVWMLFRGLRRGAGDPPVPAAGTWSSGRLAVALVAVIVLESMTFWNLDLAARQRLATLRAEAGALSLSVAPPRVADRDNAALIYRQAFEAMGPEASWPQFNESDFDPQDTELQRFLQRQSTSLAMLRYARGKSGCQFGHDFSRPSSDMSFPELFRLRGAARLLELDARRKAAGGNIRAALEDVDTLFAIARHASSEPTTVSLLMAVSIDSRAVRTLQDVLAFELPSEEDLAMVVNLDGDVSFQWLLARTYFVEEALCLSAFSMSTTFLGDARDEIGLHLHNFAPPFYRVFLLEDDLASTRRLARKLRTLAMEPYREAKEKWEAFDWEVVEDRGGILTKIVMPNLATVAKTSVAADARRHVARVGVALYRFHVRHDRFPEKMEELAPEFIAFVPYDPFDGKPLKLKRTGRGLIVYSVGPDAVDGGGTPYNWVDKTGDISFEVFVEPK